MRTGRRGFLKKGLLGGALLAAGGTGLALRRTRIAHTAKQPLRCFSPVEFAIYAAFADRIIPGGSGHPAASTLAVAEKADAVMARAEPEAQKELKQLLGLFDSALAAAVLDLRITPFTQLDPAAQDRAIEQWRRSRITLRRTGYQALKRLVCACYYGSPESYASLGYSPPTSGAPATTPASAPTPATAPATAPAPASAPASRPTQEVAP